MQARILIVDDEDAIRRMMVRMLGMKGYVASEAATGDAALLHLQTASADLVITDLIMPGMNGLELAQKLIAQDPDRPVIMMSAYGEMGDIRRAVNAGISDFLINPFDLKDALNRINRAINRRKEILT